MSKYTVHLQFFVCMNVNQGCHIQGKYLEMKFFPGQGKVREFCGWAGKFRKDLESQGI